MGGRYEVYYMISCPYLTIHLIERYRAHSTHISQPQHSGNDGYEKAGPATTATIVLGSCSGNDSRCGHNMGIEQPMTETACLKGKDCSWKSGMKCIL